ncbi:MAG: twin-arginine translocase TatA/TatE family subunit [Chloroflexota bacterium]
MPTLGAPELIIILVIIVLIFGVGKLPEVGQALGKGIREFRGAADGLEDHDEPATPAAPAAPAAPARPAAAVEAPRAPVAASTVTAAAPAAAPVAPTAPTASVSYTVVDGDTPASIAEKHGVSVDELLAANGWSKSDRVLYEGDKIQVPAKSTTV